MKLEYEPELRQFMPTSFDPGDGDDGTENARYVFKNKPGTWG